MGVCHKPHVALPAGGGGQWLVELVLDDEIGESSSHPLRPMVCKLFDWGGGVGHRLQGMCHKPHVAPPTLRRGQWCVVQVFDKRGIC